jgi:conjugative relaxase-like TrwC/TraI family protein
MSGPMIISGSQAVGYYSKLDPIFRMVQRSIWHGGLTKELKLSGSVLKADFQNLISGNDLKGNKVIKDGIDRDKNPLHRAVIDIPCTCPKSVSTVALHVGDDRLIDAHNKAVKVFIDYLESNFIYARETKNGITLMRPTGNAVFAVFSHSTSRENDPHLHSHVIIPNITKTPNGYRAICNDEIFQHQKLLNNIYLAELAKNVKDLGYDIDVKEDGNWEIAGIKREWIEAFSKRSSQIKIEYERIKNDEKNQTARDAVLWDMAIKDSRKKKNTSITKAQLLEGWESDLSKKEIEHSLQQCPKSYFKAIPAISKDYTELAYLKVHGQKTTFTKNEIVGEALKLGRGECKISDVEKAFKRKIRNGELICVSERKYSKGLTEFIYTSEKMKSAEREIFQHFAKGKDFKEPVLAAEENAKAVLQKDFSKFSKFERDISSHILSSRDRFMIIQMDGNKAYNLFEQMRIVLEGKNSPHSVKMLGFNQPPNAQSLELKGNTDHTLSEFLNRHGNRRTPELWIVDQTTVGGNFQLKALMEKATAANARIVFIDRGNKLNFSTGPKFQKGLGDLGVVYNPKLEKAKTGPLETEIQKASNKALDLSHLNPAKSIFEKEK